MSTIALATDYGVTGPYVGQLKLALLNIASNIQLVDLIHDLPKYNPRAAAYLLPGLVNRCPSGTLLIGVVDPGVGTERRAILIKNHDYILVGPDNGLFSQVVRHMGAVEVSQVIFDEQSVSTTFHGRDVFAPVVARLAISQVVDSTPIELKSLVGYTWETDLFEIIYIDYFGNAVTGIRSQVLNENSRIWVKHRELRYATKFADVPLGGTFWYRNANGLIELAAREQSIADQLQLHIGDVVRIMN